MNHNQYTKLKAIAERLTIEFNGLGVVFQYQDLKEAWDKAKYYSKIQKQSEAGDLIQQKMFFNEETKTVENFAIFAPQNYSRMQYFLIEVLNMNCSSIQTIKKVIKTFKF